MAQQNVVVLSKEPLINSWRAAVRSNAPSARWRILPSVPVIGGDPDVERDEFSRPSACPTINHTFPSLLAIGITHFTVARRISVRNTS